MIKQSAQLKVNRNLMFMLTLSLLSLGCGAAVSQMKNMGCKAANMSGASTKVAQALPDEVTASDTLVALGDVMKVKRAEVELDTNKTAIKFSQDCEEKSIDYITVGAKVEGKPEFTLFVQKSKLEAFTKGAKAEGEYLAHKITNAFQYGQDAGKTTRWVVFHDMKLKPFQSRFVKTALLSTVSSVGQAAAGAALKHGVAGSVPNGEQAAKLAKEAGKSADAAVGHFLRTFNK